MKEVKVQYPLREPSFRNVRLVCTTQNKEELVDQLICAAQKHFLYKSMELHKKYPQFLQERRNLDG